MYLVKSPWWLKKFYAGLTWNIPTEEKIIYLTFDDGPHPVATPFVLDTLSRYDAKATFFCIGQNVRAHKDIYSRILDEGHKAGNHTYNHMNGWKTHDCVYLNNVLVAKEFIESNLFRPPYGRISKIQIEQLLPVYKIIMWDVLSADFDTRVSPQKSLENVTNNAQEGSIVVFHDSEKAYPRLEYALPKTLEFFAAKGFRFEAIS